MRTDIKDTPVKPKAVKRKAAKKVVAKKEAVELVEVVGPVTVEPTIKLADAVDVLVLSIKNATINVTQDEKTKARIAHVRTLDGRLFDMNLDSGDAAHVRQRLMSEGLILG